MPRLPRRLQWAVSFRQAWKNSSTRYVVWHEARGQLGDAWDAGWMQGYRAGIAWNCFRKD